MKQWKCDNSRNFYSVFTFILEHHFQSQISLRNANTCLGNIKICLHKSIYNNFKYYQCKNKTKQKTILFLFVWTKPIEKCPVHTYTCVFVIFIKITSSGAPLRLIWVYAKAQAHVGLTVERRAQRTRFKKNCSLTKPPKHLCANAYLNTSVF